MKNTDVFTLYDFEKCGYDSSCYKPNLTAGTYDATVDFKAEAHNNRLRVFFTFDDGRNVISQIPYWRDNYLGFYSIPDGSRVRLGYNETTSGVYLTTAEILELASLKYDESNLPF